MPFMLKNAHIYVFASLAATPSWRRTISRPPCEGIQSMPRNQPARSTMGTWETDATLRDRSPLCVHGGRSSEPCACSPHSHTFTPPSSHLPAPAPDHSLAGQQKQMKRLAMYTDFCQKKRAVTAPLREPLPGRACALAWTHSVLSRRKYVSNRPLCFLRRRPVLASSGLATHGGWKVNCETKRVGRRR